MPKFYDTNNVELQNGDVIDMHQTINGCREFVIINIETYDVRYAYDLERKYEYDFEDLLSGDLFSSDVEWEIIKNIR